MTTASRFPTRHDRRVAADYEWEHAAADGIVPITRAEIEAFEQLTTTQFDLLVEHLEAGQAWGRSRPRRSLVRGIRSFWRGVVTGPVGYSRMTVQSPGWATTAIDAAHFYPFMWGYGYWAPAEDEPGSRRQRG